MKAKIAHVYAEQKQQRNDGENTEEPAPVKGFSLISGDSQYVPEINQRFQ